VRPRVALKPAVREHPKTPTHATHSLQFAVARASWTAMACHERVRGVSESLQATRESAGEGVAERCVRISQNPVIHTVTATYIRNRLGRVWLKRVSGYCAVVSFTRSLLDTYRIDSKIGGSVVSVRVDCFLGTCTTVCEQFTKYATTIHGH